MLNSSTELFLTYYFYITALVGNFLGNGEKLFYRLAKIFFVPCEEAERLYKIADSREVRQVATLNNYNQRNRLLEYYDLLGKSAQTAPEYDEVIRIKGNALASLKGTPLDIKGNAPGQVVYNTLIAAANAGSVGALFACGILQCEGIFFDKNFKAGLKKLNNAADWLDIASLLTLIEYDGPNRSSNLARLEVATYGTPYERLAQAASSSYDIPQYCGDLSASTLLLKAFNADTLKCEQYDAKASRILKSNVLSYGDKERLIYTASKELFNTVGNLPLKLGRSSFSNISRSCKLKLPFNRRAEKEEVKEWLSRYAGSGAEARPLCIVCDSEYIQGLYFNVISESLGGAHIAGIDISALTGYDLEPALGNVFVRNIDEDKFNVFMLSARGELNEQALAAVINFARGNSRRQFHIGTLGVAIDLSDIMLICFCDKRNVGAFKKHFQVIEIKELSAKERRECLDMIAATRARAYGLMSATISDEAYSSMCDCSIDRAEKAVDEAIRLNCGDRRRITLTVDMLAPYIKSAHRSAIGFGEENSVKQ